MTKENNQVRRLREICHGYKMSLEHIREIREMVEPPFSEWIRNRPDLDSIKSRLCVVDCDMMIHRFCMGIDNEGKRQVQAFMFLEVKPFGFVRNKSTPQWDTIKFFDQLVRNQKWDGFRDDWQYCTVRRLKSTQQRNKDNEPRTVTIFSFGVHLLECDSTMQRLRWNLNRDISQDDLARLIRFEVDPWRLNEQRFRRHHKTRKWEVLEKTELGFETPRLLVQRS